MKQALITFSNGVSVNVEVNGNCYITDTKPNFPVGMSRVTILSDETETVLQSASVVEIFSTDNRYWFGFKEYTEQELTTLELRSRIEYIEMMSDIEL